MLIFDQFSETMWRRQICTVNLIDKPKTGSELFWTRQKPQVITYSFATFWKLRMFPKKATKFDEIFTVDLTITT